MVKSWRWFIILLTGIILALAVGSVYAQEPETITVSGLGVVTVAPNAAVVEIGVEQNGSDLGVVNQAVLTTLTTIHAALLDAGIPETDIQIATLSVNADALVQQGVVDGRYVYQGQGTYRVVIRDLTQIETLLNSVSAQGANIIRNLVLIGSKTAEMETEARSLAIANAHDHAQEFADSLKVVLGVPISVEEIAVTSTTAVPINAPLNDQHGLAATIASGQLFVLVEVEITYRFVTPK